MRMTSNVRSFNQIGKDTTYRGSGQNTCFWVEQRFQRCVIALFSLTALALAVRVPTSSATSYRSTNNNVVFCPPLAAEGRLCTNKSGSIARFSSC
jgi:hypothetical protein